MRAIGLGLALATVWLEASPYLSRPVQDLEAAPFRSTGKVVVPGEWSGSGVIAESPFAFFTAGHVLFDPVQRQWVDEIYWREATKGDSIPVRSFRVIASYAAAVDEDGMNSAEAFQHDAAVGFAYERLGSYTSNRSLQAATDLESSLKKMIAGYSVFQSSQGFVGPFSLPFRHEQGDFYLVHDVTLGAGGSGGGTWIERGGGWLLAGLYVAGADTRAGAPRSIAGVVALSAAKVRLLEDAVGSLTPRLPGFGEVPSEVVLRTAVPTEVRIAISGFPPPETEWQWRANGSIRTWGHGAIEDGTAVTQIGRDEGIPDGAELRLRLTNTAGTTHSSWIPVRYAIEETPFFVAGPESLTLAPGASGAFQAEVAGSPTPQLQWEVQDRGGSWQAVDLPNAKSAKLSFAPGDDYYDNAYFRLRATNVLGTVYSDPVQLRVPPPLLEGSYTGDIRPFLGLGESFTVGVALNADPRYGVSVSWKVGFPNGETHSPFWIPNDYGEITVENNGSMLSGSTLHAVLERRRYDFLYQTDIVELPPILLRGEAVPDPFQAPEAVEAGGGSTQAELMYRLPVGGQVEWQVWDEIRAVWRPVESDPDWRVETRESYSVLHLNAPGRAARVRVVLRAEGFPAVASEPSDISFRAPSAADLQTVIEPLHLNRERLASAHVTADRLLVVVRKLFSSEFRVIQLDEVGGEWRALPVTLPSPTPEPLAMTAHQGRLLFATPDSVEGQAEIVVYGQDLTGRWSINDRFAVPALPTDGFLRVSMETVGAMLLVGTTTADGGVFSLFRPDVNGVYSAVQTIPSGTGPIPSPDGFFIVHATNLGWPNIPPPGAPEEGIHEVVHYRYNGESGRFEPRSVGRTRDVPVVMMAGRELWSVKYWPDNGMVWHRVTLDESRDIASDVLDTVPPMVGAVIKGDGELAWLRRTAGTGSLPPEDPVSLYRLSVDGRMEGPAIIRPDNWDMPWSYAKGEVFFGEKTIFVVNSSTEKVRVDCVPREDLSFAPLSGRQPLWTRVQSNPDFQHWKIQFRSPAGSSSAPTVTFSNDLSNWQEMEDPTLSILDPDIDGDGSTELREVEVPMSQQGVPVFYRLEESAAD